MLKKVTTLMFAGNLFFGVLLLIRITFPRISDDRVSAFERDFSVRFFLCFRLGSLLSKKAPSTLLLSVKVIKEILKNFLISK